MNISDFSTHGHDGSQTSRRGTRVRIVLLWALATPPVLIIWIYAPASYFSRLIEALVYLAILLLLFRFTNVPAVFAPLRTRYKVFLGAMLVLLLLGQLGGKNWTSFPFVRWAMFGSVVTNTNIDFLEYRARLASGDTINITPQWVIPSLRNGRLNAKMRTLSKCADPSRNVTDRACLDLYSDTLVLVGRQYNESHPGDPIRSIIVYRNRFGLNDYSGESSIARTPLWRVELE